MSRNIFEAEQWVVEGKNFGGQSLNANLANLNELGAHLQPKIHIRNSNEAR